MQGAIYTNDGYKSPEKEKEMIMNHKGFSISDTKHVFSRVLDSDINSIRKLLNDKLKELRKKMLFVDPTTLEVLLPDEFHKKLNTYAKELAIQYDKSGLQKTYKKITRVLSEITNTCEYKDDLEIVKEIKNEYITTKKMPKSNMLYLNKIYKQLIKNEEDDANTKSQGAEKENRNRSNRMQRFTGPARIK